MERGTHFCEMEKGATFVFILPLIPKWDIYECLFCCQGNGKTETDFACLTLFPVSSSSTLTAVIGTWCSLSHFVFTLARGLKRLVHSTLSACWFLVLGIERWRHSPALVFNLIYKWLYKVWELAKTWLGLVPALVSQSSNRHSLMHESRTCWLGPGSGDAVRKSPENRSRFFPINWAFLLPDYNKLGKLWESLGRVARNVLTQFLGTTQNKYPFLVRNPPVASPTCCFGELPAPSLILASPARDDASCQGT